MNKRNYQDTAASASASAALESSSESEYQPGDILLTTIRRRRRRRRFSTLLLLVLVLFPPAVGGVLDNNNKTKKADGGNNSTSTKNNNKNKTLSSTRNEQEEHTDDDDDESNTKQQRRRMKREAKFQHDIAQMNKEKRKLAMKQKKKDTKIVRRILRAASKDDHYAVLGLRFIEIRIPSIQLLGAPGHRFLTIPSLSLFHIPESTIKRAYRIVARSVHPDKNHDEYADDAFHAIDNSMNILLDNTKREEYDQQRLQIRKDKIQTILQNIVNLICGIVDGMSSVISIIRRLLGPVALPIFVILVLII